MPNFLAGPHRLCLPCGGGERPGGQRPPAEVAAARLALVDQHDLDAVGCRSGRDGEAAGSGADDADVGSKYLCHECPLPRP